MRESQIIYENGIFWVLKEQGLFFVMKNVGTHSEQVGTTAWRDESIAKAYCDYQAQRNS